MDELLYLLITEVAAIARLHFLHFAANLPQGTATASERQEAADRLNRL
jgi:hypothetical protein